MKFVAVLLFTCIVGPAVAQGGYTQTQETFLMGTDPVKSSMDDFSFDQYVQSYWSSYIENLAEVSASPLPIGTADVGKTMSIWLAGFPLDADSSSFGEEPVTSEEQVTVFSIGSGRGNSDVLDLYMEDGTRTNNSDLLEQEIKANFGL